MTASSLRVRPSNFFKPRRNDVPQRLTPFQVGQRRGANASETTEERNSHERYIRSSQNIDGERVPNRAGEDYTRHSAERTGSRLARRARVRLYIGGRVQGRHGRGNR